MQRGFGRVDVWRTRDGSGVIEISHAEAVHQRIRIVQRQQGDLEGILLDILRTGSDRLSQPQCRLKMISEVDQQGNLGNVRIVIRLEVLPPLRHLGIVVQHGSFPFAGLDRGRPPRKERQSGSPSLVHLARRFATRQADPKRIIVPRLPGAWKKHCCRAGQRQADGKGRGAGFVRSLTRCAGRERADALGQEGDCCRLTINEKMYPRHPSPSTTPAPEPLRANEQRWARRGECLASERT